MSRKAVYRTAFRRARAGAVGLLFALGMLVLAPAAFAHEGYRPSGVSFEPFRSGVFDAIAVDNSVGPSAGDIYAAAETRTLYEFLPEGALARMVDVPESDGERMRGIAVDSSTTSSAGDVYVVMVGLEGESPGTAVPVRGAIYRLNAEGELSGWGPEVDSSPAGIAVGPSGEVFVVQSGGGGSGQGDVLEFSSSGEELNEGRPVVEGLKLPGGIAVDSHGDLYVTNCNKEIGLVESTPLEGGGYSAPRTIAPETTCDGADVAVDSQTGEIFLATGNAVRVFDSAGSQVGGPALGSEVQGSIGEYRYFAVGDNEANGDVYATNNAAGFPTDATVEAAEPGPEAPTIASESVGAFNVTEHEATLEAAVNPQGLSTTYDFYLDGEQVGSGNLVASESDQDLNVKLSGLEPDHIYSYWVNATTSAGTSNGPKREFITNNAVSPGADTGPATDVTPTSATLTGSLIKHDAFSAEYVFEYGPTTSYGMTAPTPPMEIHDGFCGILCEIKGPVSVTAAIAGLEPGTTYHYRIVSGDAWGTGYGTDVTFSTKSPQSEVDPSKGGSNAGPLEGGEGSPQKSGGSARNRKLTKALARCARKQPKNRRRACEKKVRVDTRATAPPTAHATGPAGPG